VRRLLERVVAVPGRLTATGQRSDGGVPTDLAIEPMRRKHLRQILPIEQQLYPRPWTIGIFHGELDGARDGHRYYLVAKSRGDVVGYGGMLYSMEDAHITNVAVNPTMQRRGIGRVLMVALVDKAIDHGSVNLSLEVRVSNKAAQELYRQFGFAPAGVRPRYYENVEDAIIMWCHDINTPDYVARLAGLAAQ
jgi:[ribosomal protein S18]-alanine N-acetyltransferase